MAKKWLHLLTCWLSNPEKTLIRFMSLMFLCQTWGRACVKARHKNLSTRQPKHVLFSVQVLTLWLRFSPPIAHTTAKNRFSQRFLLMQKGVSLYMQQNEYLFQRTAICTRFRAFCCKMECVLPLNAMHFGAKCSAF